MNKQIISNEIYENMKKAYENTLGTDDYAKYVCEGSFKEGNVWYFLNWDFPNQGYIKKIRNDFFLYDDKHSIRYRLSKGCKEFLGL